MTTLGSALEAFIREHEYCGSWTPGSRTIAVWVTCTCGARINLSFDMAHTGGSLGSDVQG